MFHTPPALQERSFIAEQESYGYTDSDPLELQRQRSAGANMSVDALHHHINDDDDDPLQATVTGPPLRDKAPPSNVAIQAHEEEGNELESKNSGEQDKEEPLTSMPSPPSIATTFSNDSRRSSNHTSVASEDGTNSLNTAADKHSAGIVDPLVLEELASAASSDIRRGSGASTTTTHSDAKSDLKFDATSQHSQHSQQSQAQSQTRSRSRSYSYNNMPRKLPSRLNHYIELFLNSLQEPRYTTPLTGDDISGLYQDFYKRFSVKADEFLQGKAASSSQASASSQDSTPKEVALNSMEEIAERKKERSLRPSRINVLLELAELKACSSVYDKIFSVAHGDDRVRNELIQEKVNVLDKFPVTLEALGIDNLAYKPPLSTEFNEDPDATTTELSDNKPDNISLILQEAGSELREMNKATYPKQKLLHLSNTHRTIVRILSEGKDSSADAILPCLIYTMIKTQTPNIWLNLKFIQRFRNVDFLNGESMYCLTNFEAATMFLETCSAESLGLDISKALPGLDITCLLTSDPLASGLGSGSGNSPMNNSPSFLTLGRPRKGSSATINSVASVASSTRGSRSNSLNKDNNSRLGTTASLSPTATSRRLSLLQLHPGEIASNAADISIKSIGSTFGSSYRFLVGKLSEKRGVDGDDNKYPHTLAEARKVVGLEPESPAHSIKDFNMSNEQQPSSSIASTMTPSHSMSSISESLGATTGGAGMTSPMASEKDKDRGAVESSTSSVFGKLTGGVMKNFRSASVTSADAAPPGVSAVSSASSSSSSSGGPIERFLTTDFEDLKISDLKELHADYKRLASLVKANVLG